MGDNDKSLDDAWADALEEASGATPAEESSEGDWDNLADSGNGASSDAATFAELGNGAAPAGSGHNLDFLLDIPLQVSVELGRTNMIIDKMLQLTIKGSENVEIVFLKDKYGCFITADANWNPLPHPDHPDKIKKYNFQWLPPDFEFLVDFTMVLDANLLFVNVFHLDMPKWTVRFDLEETQDTIELYAKTTDVQVRSAKIGGIESKLLRRARLTQLRLIS